MFPYAHRTLIDLTENMPQPKVSIIVPIHNAREHLDKCLASLASQMLKDIEIVLVIDCPTDGSDSVAEKFAQRDNRVKIIRNSENIHIGLSRNRGINAASGEYIGFCDHDDVCDPKMFELLYTKAKEQDADIVKCNYYLQAGGVLTEHITPANDFAPIDEIIKGIFTGTTSVTVWCRIFKAQFIYKHRLKFRDTRHLLGEDRLFCAEAYYAAQQVADIPNMLYYHIFHDGNTSSCGNHLSLHKGLAYVEQMDNFLTEHKLTKCYPAFARSVIETCYTPIINKLKQLHIKSVRTETHVAAKNKVVTRYLNLFFKPKNRTYMLRTKITKTIFALYLLLLGKLTA